MSGRFRVLGLAAVALWAGLGPASARERVILVGQPGALDHAAARARSAVPSAPPPLLEPAAADEAIQRFCAGLGAQTPDGLALLRRLRFDERERCAANGVADFVEIDLGTVGFIVVGAPATELSRHELWLALAAARPKAGRIEPNALRSWHEVAARLPDRPIRLSGPDPASEAGALLAALILEDACESVPSLARLLAREPALRPRLCASLRRDAAYRPGAAAEPETTALLGLAELDWAAASVIAIEGVRPEAATIQSGKYPLARRVWLTLKRAHLGAIAGLSGLAAALR